MIPISLCGMQALEIVLPGLADVEYDDTQLL
jgi:hypothetical protein